MAAPVSSTSKSPVSSAQVAVNVKGQRTDIHCSVFTDQLYVIVTQFCKLGTLVQVKPETVVDDMEGTTPVLTAKVLFGNDEPLVHVISRRIAASLKPSKPVLLALSLKDTSREAVFPLLPAIQSCVARAQGGNSAQPISEEVLVR
ncbi:proteasome assembly chaperone 3-like [Littorina saxatilis]|uniref:Proteasome assembly chaperone 3 n=1 Tax=Littorina saxatilis TaxID=31220 RepID=A0AAN9B9T2_9CAEN